MHYTAHETTGSLYIHWPFCPYKCHFCPFVAIASHDSFMPAYHEALKSEVRAYCAQLTQKKTLHTVYFGGGTPSTYPNDLLLDMFGTLREKYGIENTTEVTVEVNPGTVVDGQLAFWKEIGVNRLSIGVQSLNDKVLHALNRWQSADDVYRLINDASLCIENISVDIILGLPGVSHDEWRELLKKVCSWPIKHISMYFLTVHENTPLYNKVQKKQVEIIGDDSMVDLYEESRAFLIAHGFGQYEICSFAKPGYRSRHNTVYWEHIPYKGFGLGACSFDGSKRFQNEKNLMKYIQNAQDQNTVTVFCEELSAHQVRIEKIMLGLRRAEGISRAWLLDINDTQRAQEIAQKIELYIQQKFLIDRAGIIYLTPAGLAVENELVVQLS